jgi:branched-subunit amino acid transport protein
VNGIDSWGHMSLAIAGMALATVLTRGSFFMLPASLQLPPRVERALQYAPACALAAIIAPDILTRDQSIYLSWHNNELWAVAIAAVVFAKTRNMIVMMVVGMVAFTLLRLYT